jgi:hypothetical protein
MWIGKKLGDSKNATKLGKEESRVAPKVPRTVPLVAVPKLEHILKKRRSQIQPSRS